MLYPKTPEKKKRKKHSKSIIPQEPGTCYICVELYGDHRWHTALHEHHIFGGPNRRLSEEYGLKVKLCLDHHEFSKEAAHNNADITAFLHKRGQEAFERRYPERDFRKIFGRNYL